MRLKNKKCPWCDTIVQPYGSGKKVVFCDDKCQQSYMYEKRSDMRWKARQGYADDLFNRVFH